MFGMATADEDVSAPSTAAGGEGLKADHQLGVSLGPLPIIDLPHSCDENGKLVAGNFPARCPRCQWQAPHDPFAFAYPGLLKEARRLEEAIKADPFDCASCEVIRCTLIAMASPKQQNIINLESTRLLSDGNIVDRTKLAMEAVLLSSRFCISAAAPTSGHDNYYLPRIRIPNDSYLSETSSAWARECIAECARSHEHCHSPTNGRYLPTRLIGLRRVGDHYDLRLENHDSISPGSPYIALSYCWGNFKPACMTTAKTLDQNLDAIPWATLPQTFQDAARFTLSLGVQYLWIDSICIIQNDQKDWQQEARSMYAVYKNSLLTLAALSGPDSTYGLRTTSVKESSAPIAQLQIAQNTLCTLYLRRLHYLDRESRDNHDQKHQIGLHYYPLLERAWTYQERIIPPRVMFFTEGEMIYQCLEDAKCECGDAQQGHARTKQIVLNKTQIFLSTSYSSSHSASVAKIGKQDRNRAYDVSTNSIGTPMATDRASRIAWTWRKQVVPEYSALRISLPRDRLPALGAIAEQFHNVRPNEQYLAGLWSGTLLEDLLWTCSSTPIFRGLPQNCKLNRPFNLPTWSWASLQSPIWYYQTGYNNISPKATVVEAYCSYAEGNMFGVLERSKMVLRGRILPCSLEWVEDESQFQHCDLLFLDGDTRMTIGMDSHNVNIDYDEYGYQNSPLFQEIHLLEVLIDTRSISPDRMWEFLILRREGQDDIGSIYTRAGVLMLHYGKGQGSNQSKKSNTQDLFGRLFEAHSVLTTCEIR